MQYGFCKNISLFTILPHRNNAIGIPHMSMSSERICRLRHSSFLEDADGTGQQQTLFGT
jgi:hypothetical protein